MKEDNEYQVRDVIDDVIEELRKINSGEIIPVFCLPLNISYEALYNYTKKDIEDYLKSIGIRRNFHSFCDYEKAKKNIFDGAFIDCNVYERIMRWVADYICV